MTLRFPFMAAFLTFGSTAGALANGAWAEFPAGGIVFKSDKDIAILSEDLEIGRDHIRVRYVFGSSAGEPLERTIGFPMAKVPLDDSPDNFDDRSRAEEGQDARNYMAFKVTVNGKPLEPKLHEYAWSGDTNVTAGLSAMGVPVFAGNPDAYQRLAALPEATVRWLKQEKLAQQDGGWLIPQWQYQSAYEWTQTFGPGRTEVEVSYKPLFGSYYGPEPYFEGGSGAAEYCFDGATRQKLAKLQADGAFPEPFTVGYVLTTAGNWKGPIGAFRLVLSVEGDDFARFCVPEGLKAVGDGVTWTAEEFEPSSDLDIVFFHRGS